MKNDISSITSRIVQDKSFRQKLYAYLLLLVPMDSL